MNHFLSHLPIWYQLTQMLRAEIASGKRRAGERIESEVRLAELYGISVAPVRQALRALEQERLIVRRRGSGTFVGETCRPPHDTTTPLETLYSREFTKLARIFSRGEAPVPPDIAAHFQDVDSLSFVQRLAFRDGLPWSFGTLYFRSCYAGRIGSDELARLPLYRLLRERCGVELVRSHFNVRAVAASTEVARHLEVERFSPVLLLASVGFDDTGNAVGAFEMAFAGDPMSIDFDTPH